MRLPAAVLAFGLPCLLAAGAARADLAEARGLAADEAEFCRQELDTLERRARVLEGKGLPPAEVKKRNAAYEQFLSECRGRFRGARRQEEAELRLRQEIAARTPVGATEVERERIAREVRLSHARARPRQELSPADRQLLEEAEAAEASRRRAEARLHDPALRRKALSGQRCVHLGRRDLHRRQLQEEERIGGLDGGDRQRRYFLRAEIKREEEALRVSAAELATAGGPLPCRDPFVARVAECIQAHDADRAEPACAATELREALQVLTR